MLISISISFVLFGESLKICFVALLFMFNIPHFVLPIVSNPCLHHPGLFFQQSIHYTRMKILSFSFFVPFFSSVFLNTVSFSLANLFFSWHQVVLLVSKAHMILFLMRFWIIFLLKFIIVVFWVILFSPLIVILIMSLPLPVSDDFLILILI